MIGYEGPGYYFIVVEDKILKIYYFGSVEPGKQRIAGEPFLIDNEIKFWERVSFVIQDHWL